MCKNCETFTVLAAAEDVEAAQETRANIGAALRERGLPESVCTEVDTVLNEILALQELYKRGYSDGHDEGVSDGQWQGAREGASGAWDEVVEILENSPPGKQTYWYLHGYAEAKQSIHNGAPFCGDDADGG